MRIVKIESKASLMPPQMEWIRFLLLPSVNYAYDAHSTHWFDWRRNQLRLRDARIRYNSRTNFSRHENYISIINIYLFPRQIYETRKVRSALPHYQPRRTHV